MGFAIRRPMRTATAAMARADSRNDSTNVERQGGAPGGGPTSTFSQRPSPSATQTP